MNNLTNDVVVSQRDEMQTSKEPITEKQTIVVIFSLLEALSYEFCSPDAWWLAEHRAKQMALNAGISENSFEEIMQKFHQARQKANRQNPMHSMF